MHVRVKLNLCLHLDYYDGIDDHKHDSDQEGIFCESDSFIISILDQ